MKQLGEFFLMPWFQSGGAEKGEVGEHGQSSFTVVGYVQATT